MHWRLIVSASASFYLAGVGRPFSVTLGNARSGHGLAYDTVRDRVVLFGGLGGGGTITAFLNDTWEWDGSQWSPVADTGPPPRSNLGMVFDGTRALLFGGGGSKSFFGDTWSWDGKHWTEIQDIGPGPRAPAGMVYDSDRNRSVLFGGGAFLGDTWELYEHS